MMVFMVRGLFSKLQFPYAQFPAADLTNFCMSYFGKLYRELKNVDSYSIISMLCTM